MRIFNRRASPQRELIARDPTSSFAAFRFRSPSFPFVWHYHPEVELTCIVRGSGLRFLGDSIEAFAPGDLVLIGENVPHTWQSSNSPATADESVEAIVIQFPAALLGDALRTVPEFAAIQTLLTNSARGLSADDPTLRELVFDQMAQLTAAPAGTTERLLGLIRSLHLIADAFARKTVAGKAASRALRLPIPPQRRPPRRRLDASIGACAAIAQRITRHRQQFHPIRRRPPGANVSRVIQPFLPPQSRPNVRALREGMACRAGVRSWCNRSARSRK